MSLHDTLDLGLAALIDDAPFAPAIGAVLAGVSTLGLIEIVREWGSFRVKGPDEPFGGALVYPDSKNFHQNLAQFSTTDLEMMATVLQDERADILEQERTLKDRLREVSEARDEIKMAASMRPTQPRVNPIGRSAMMWAA